MIKGQSLICRSPAGSAPGLTELSGEIRFFADCQFIAGYGLRGCPQFLAMMASTPRHLILSKPDREQSTSKMEITVLYKWITEKTSHHFTLVHSVEACHHVQPTPKNCTEHESIESRSFEAMSEAPAKHFIVI